jgi:hypothetical protein
LCCEIQPPKSFRKRFDHISLSVSEYRGKFIQLSRYAPDEVAEDERKKEHFIEGLNGPLQYALVAHTFPSF